MEITKGVKIVDLALYLEKYRILVIGDLHLGYEEALNKQGLLVPRFQYTEIIKRLEDIMKKVSPDTVVINGDLKHEFGTISDQEWRQALNLIDFFAGKKIIIVKGNHDTIIGPIADRKNVEVVKQFDIADEFTIVHGNFIPEKMNRTVIIGHEHPAVTFPDRPDEKYKCFLYGKYKRHKLVVMPSFNFVTAGTDVQREQLLSPFLHGQKLDGFDVFIVENSRAYRFGKLKNIRKMR
ncbi:MAG: metallophosphoesterase [Candidatus Woesearchaeota archaeon]